MKSIGYARSKRAEVHWMPLTFNGLPLMLDCEGEGGNNYTSESHTNLTGFKT